MLFKRLAIHIVNLLCLAFSINASANSTIFSESFEYSSLSEMKNSGWETFVGGSNSSIELSQEQAFSGKNSLKIINRDSKTIYALMRLTGTNSPPPQSNVKVSFKLYDANTSSGGIFVDVRNTKENQLTLLGVRSDVDKKHYYYRTAWQSRTGLPTHTSREQAWKELVFYVTPHGTFGQIGNINMAYLKAEGSQTAINTQLKEIDRIAIASTWEQLPEGTFYIDDIKIEPLPSHPTTNLDIDYHFLKVYSKLFLDQNTTDIDQVTYEYARKYRLFANNAVVKSVMFNKFGNLQDLVFAKKYIFEDLKHLSTLDWGVNRRSNDFWTAPLSNYALGLASWLIWDHLSQSERDQVFQQLSTEAMHIAKQQPITRYIDNTGAEENAWNAEFLALMSQMFSSDARSEYWERKARTYAFHSFTINERYNAATTQNLHHDSTLANHRFHPNPEYALVSIGLLGQGALTYKLNGKDVPWEFSHRVNEVYNAHAQQFDTDLWLYNHTVFKPDFGGKSDWMTDASVGTQNAFQYLSFINPSLQPLRDKLALFQWYTHNNYLAFPKEATVYPNHDVFINAPGGPYLHEDQIWFYNSNCALRYATNILWQDSDLTVVDTTGTFSAIAPIFTEDFEYNSINEMASNGWSTSSGTSSSYMTISTDVAHSGSQSLKIVNSNNSLVYALRQFTSDPSIPPQSDVKVSFWLYDASLGAGGLFVDVRDEDSEQLALAGIRQELFPDAYFFRKDWSGGNGIQLPFTRSQGWHKFEFVVSSQGGTYAILDNTNLRDVVYDNALNTQLKEMDRITIASTWDQIGTGIFYLDDLKIIPFGK